MFPIMSRRDTDAPPKAARRAAPPDLFYHMSASQGKTGEKFRAKGEP